MEKLKVKHDHKLTDIVKVCIFSLFLILPILMFLPNALYFGFNEHAQLSNSEPTVNVETTQNIQYQFTTNDVNNENDILPDNIYYIATLTLNDLDFSDDTDYGHIYIYKADYIETTVQTNYDAQFEGSYYSSYLSLTGSNNRLYLSFTSNNSYVDFEIDEFYAEEVYLKLEDEGQLFDIIDHTEVEKSNWLGEIINATASSTYTIDYEDTTISGAIYNGWKGIWETPLLNWTDSNNFSFTINAFTNVFGITEQSKIANYLCYIMTLLVIYIIYDIVITLFTKMTHLLNE